MLNKEVAVAPMMDWTDRHCRYFLRLIAPSVRLYTEMITAQALVYGRNPASLLAFNPAEHDVALQLGGSDPALLAKAAQMGALEGYDEINLNVGCPSPRVSAGRFGACLMKEPALVAECIAAMKAVVNVPVTVKCRIGVDDQDGYDALAGFINQVSLAGCQKFIIHARKAWLSGLSPKENRDVPPLQYEMVRQIKMDFDHLAIIINGGLTSVDKIRRELISLDGVMIGRAAYHHPWLLHQVELARGLCEPLNKQVVIDGMVHYAREEVKKGAKLHNIVRHMLGLFQGECGAVAWRRYLSTQAIQRPTDVSVIEEAFAMVKEIKLQAS